MKELKKNNSFPAHEKAMWESIADTLNEKAISQGNEPIYNAESAYAYSKSNKAPKKEAREKNEKKYNEAPSFADRDPAMLKAEFEKILASFNNSKISKSPEEAYSMAMIKMIRPELKSADEIRKFMGESLSALENAGPLTSLQHNVSTAVSHLSNFFQTGLNKLRGDDSKDFGLHLDALKSTVDSMAKINSEGLGERMKNNKISNLDSMLEDFNKNEITPNQKNKKII